MTQIDPNLDFVKTVYAKKMIDNLTQTEKDNALYNSAISTIESYTKEQLIDEMELSVRSHNCLQAAGIKFIYELVSKEENQMLKYKNFGRKSLTELVEKLDQMGLSFGIEVDKYLKEEV